MTNRSESRAKGPTRENEVRLYDMENDTKEEFGIVPSFPSIVARLRDHLDLALKLFNKWFFLQCPTWMMQNQLILQLNNIHVYVLVYGES